MDDLHDDLTAHVADELASADGGQLAPLSDARLAVIREWAEAYHGWEEWTCRDMVDDLLAEVTRRREREAALLNLSRVALDNHQRREAALVAVVRAVDHYGSPCSCPDTEAPHWHEADCPVAQARAALADADAGKE